MKLEFTMPIKKPPPGLSTVAKPETRPGAGKNLTPKPPARPQPDNRWQRTKRYGWDSR
jgi:hypothetical protein